MSHGDEVIKLPKGFKVIAKSSNSKFCMIENIKKRGRIYEQNIEASYLQKIHVGYINFIKTEQDLNTLIIDVSELDFVNNHKDYREVLKIINTHPPSKERS